MSIAIAREIARKAHENQTYDKPGDYFEAHVCQVVLQLYDAGINDEETIMAAYLHDVLEDNPNYSTYTLQREGIPMSVVEIVKHLTKQQNECPLQYLLRLSKDQKALDIKLADAKVNARGGRGKYKITVPLLEALKDGTLLHKQI